MELYKSRTINKMDKPLITTVIPTYRRPQLLKRAILSVLDQTYQNFQIFVCDNASGDETAQVVAEIAKKDSRVKYYCQEKNIGYPKNFVFGMKLINTPFFSFLSDDDMLLPNFYQTTMEGFNKYPEAMFSTTGLVSVDEKKRIGILLKDWQDGIYYPPDGFIKQIKTIDFSMLATLYRKEVVEKMGLFDDNFTYFIDEYIPRLTTKLPYVVSTEPCFIAWIHGFSLSNAGRLKARAVFSDFNRFVDKVRQWVLQMDIPEKKKQEIIVHVSQFSKPALYYICRHSIWNKDFGNATEAVNILRKELNAKRIFMLELILGTFKTFPWALNFAYPLLEIRKYIRSYKSRQTLHSMGYLENILKTINKLSH